MPEQMPAPAGTGEGRWLGSGADPGGVVCERDGRILRGIRPAWADFYAGLLHRPAIQRLNGQQVVETACEPDGLAGYPLTLRHRRIAPRSFCYEWPLPMLRDAALLTLDICLELAAEGLTLQDASPYNVLFEGTQPILVDFTSIVPEHPHLLWVAYGQFCQLFLYPLLIASTRTGKLARALLRDPLNGVSDGDLWPLLPAGATLRMPWLLGRLHLPRLLLGLLRRVSNEKALAGASARLRPGLEARQAFFRSLRRDVQSIPYRARSRWSRYYADLGTFLRPAEFDLKQATVARLLGTLRPSTVSDLGCNLGGYAILAAQAGARVTAFDSDDDSVGLLYGLAREKQLPILPLAMDVLNPSPSCGWRGLEYEAAPARLRSQMALALALVHHLAISQHQTFERIVAALADYAGKWLLTEFVPLSDPRSQELVVTVQRDMSWYTLEGFTAALGQAFAGVECFPSHPKGRTLILCTR